MESQVKKLAETAPLSYLITRQLQDHKGRTLAVIRGIDEDLHRHVIHQTASYIQMSSFFLQHVIEGVREKFKPTADDLLDHIIQSPAFDIERKETLKKGLEAYLQGEWTIALHLLIPQIEHALRNLISTNHGNILKKNDDGGFDVKGMGEILRDPLIKAIFGEDGAFYLSTLLTDRKGLNIRNDVSHGLMMPHAFNRRLMDWVFHCILLIALVERQEETPDQN